MKPWRAHTELCDSRTEVTYHYRRLHTDRAIKTQREEGKKKKTPFLSLLSIFFSYRNKQPTSKAAKHGRTLLNSRGKVKGNHLNLGKNIYIKILIKMGFSMKFTTVKPESGMIIQQKGCCLNSLVASTKVWKMKKNLQKYRVFISFVLHLFFMSTYQWIKIQLSLQTKHLNFKVVCLEMQEFRSDELKHEQKHSILSERHIASQLGITNWLPSTQKLRKGNK